jgi:hypothetical protein
MKKEVLGFFGFKTPDVFRLVAMDNWCEDDEAKGCRDFGDF